MATTSPDDIWTPDSGEGYDLIVDLAAMADTVQSALVLRSNYYRGTTAARTAAVADAPEGAVWYDTDVEAEYRKLGAAWVIYSSGWTNWATAPTGITVGNGTLTQKYRYSGGSVVVKGSFVLGSTSAIPASVSFTHPVTIAAPETTLGFPLGGAKFITAAGTRYNGLVMASTALLARPMAINTSAAWSLDSVITATVPFTWTTGDSMYWTYTITPA